MVVCSTCGGLLDMGREKKGRSVTWVVEGGRWKEGRLVMKSSFSCRRWEAWPKRQWSRSLVQVIGLSLSLTLGSSLLSSFGLVWVYEEKDGSAEDEDKEWVGEDERWVGRVACMHDDGAVCWGVAQPITNSTLSGFSLWTLSVSLSSVSLQSFSP